MQRLSDIFSLMKVNLAFSKLDFWLFFFVVMIVFSLLYKHRLLRSIYLVVVSLFFYFKTSGLSVFILIFILLSNYSLALWIEIVKQKWKQKTVLILGISLNVLTLFYFKYAYFFTHSFNEVFYTKYEVFNVIAYFQNGFSTSGRHHIFERLLLPAGVSFFVFTSIGYIVDVYRKTTAPVKNIFHYSFFVTFFPHLILGPIARAKEFVAQIYAPFRLNKDDFSWSVFQIVKGLFKKLILADYIAIRFIDLVVDSPDSYPGFVALTAMIGYSLQIYGDFSGYIDMATGVARLMGFKLKKNFNSPYKSLSTAEFWRRWHITLSHWWKDYLYIPLGGNRTGGVGSILVTTIIFIFMFFITQWKALIFVYTGLMSAYLLILLLFPKFKRSIYRDFNIFITMVVGGLWHNPNQNFVVWGAINGVGLLFYKHWQKISPYENSNAIIVRVWKIMLTFTFITFSRIWFRVEGGEEPWHYFLRIIHHFDFSIVSFVLMCSTFTAPLLIIIIGLFIHWTPEKCELFLLDNFKKMHFLLQVLVVCISVLAMYQLIADASKSYVYFSF